MSAYEHLDNPVEIEVWSRAVAGILGRQYVDSDDAVRCGDRVVAELRKRLGSVSNIERLTKLEAERKALCAAVSVPPDASESVLMQAVAGYRTAFNRSEETIAMLHRQLEALSQAR